MQTPTWYLNRLSRMSAAEMAWRLRARLRLRADQVAWRLRQRAQKDTSTVPFEVDGGAILPDLGGESELPLCGESRSALIDAADRLLAGRMDLFDRRNVEVGESIDWNFEYKANRPTPRCFAGAIDYRDYAVTGDCKWVWEVNRHHHLVVLGRAYRVTGDRRYAAHVAGQLEAWMDACPLDTGMNWRSPLELGVRLINWAWAVELVRPSGCLEGDLGASVATSAAAQARDISRKYSRHSSANNHLVGEAAGVFVAACYFKAMPDAQKLRRDAQAILEREIVAQTYADGANREQAFGYHLFVMELFTVAAVCARHAGCDFSDAFWDRLRALYEFAAAMLEAGSAVDYGDCDDAYVLELSSPRRDAQAHLATGDALFGTSTRASAGGPPLERVLWLLGARAAASLAARAYEPADTLTSRAFPDAGIYLLQRGSLREATDVRVFVDCGELGMGSLAAHGHADALSIAVRAFGADVIVDAGTYDYFTYPEWRDYFRRTAAHNTIEVDGADQSEPLGPFMWGRRAITRCLRWEGGAGGVVEGDHDGYMRLADPVRHRRRVVLPADDGEIEIQDVLTARARHDVTLRFHLASGCVAKLAGPGCVEARFATGVMTLTLDPAFEVRLTCGELSPIRGWTSTGYHQKQESPTIEASTTVDGNRTWVTRLRLQSSSSTVRRGRGTTQAIGACR